MALTIGLDVGKGTHWVVALRTPDEVVWEQAVPNTGDGLDAMLAAVEALDGVRTWGVDLVGGVGALATAVLLAAGETVVYVPGVVVNRARDAQVGGETKSDPRDARVIASEVGRRSDLRVLTPDTEMLAALRVLVTRRRNLVTQQTRRLAQLREYLVTIHPSLERELDVTTQSALVLVRRYVTPGELRTAGPRRVTQYLRRQGVRAAHATRLAERAVASAARQRIAVAGETVTATVCKELATEALGVRTRLHALEQELTTVLATHPEAALIQSLPGMGVVLTSELLAVAGDWHRFRSPDAWAAAAGLAPVLRQSGRTRFHRRARRGHKVLKWVFYQSAHCAVMNRDPASRAFYDRKRAEGKSHRQALLTLARRRVNVLWTMLVRGVVYEAPNQIQHAA